MHSARFHPQWANASYTVKPQVWYQYTPAGSQLIDAQTQQPLPPPNGKWTHNPWDDLRTLLNDVRFPNPFMGYFSYELLHTIEKDKLPQCNHHPWPLIELTTGPIQQYPAQPDPTPLTQILNIKDHTTTPSHNPETHQPSERRSELELVSNFSPAAYQQTIQKVIDYIAAGDIFQVNLAQKLNTTYKGEPRSLFSRLMQISPAWYGAYFELPHQRVLMSTSPELFLKLQNRRVITRPIKGTRPVSTDVNELIQSEKDAAELHMIVDLMRNDLGRVCEYGSVKVLEGRTVETHPTIHHGVSTIEGQLHPSFDVIDLLKATFPGGSITGAPKVRAMQIIQELEPDPRGPYCGAIGMISKESLHLNIAIRTMMLNPTPTPTPEQTTPTPAPTPEPTPETVPITSEAHDKNAETPHHTTESPTQPQEWQVDFSVGGGIVADSNPESEYQETLDKAAAIIEALKNGS